MANDGNQNGYDSDSDSDFEDKFLIFGYNALMLSFLLVGGCICGAFIGAAFPIAIGTLVGAGLGLVFGLSAFAGQFGIQRYLTHNDKISALAFPLLSVTGIGAGIGLILGSVVFPGLGSALGASIGASIGFGFGVFSALAVIISMRCFKKGPIDGPVDLTSGFPTGEDDRLPKIYPYEEVKQSLERRFDQKFKDLIGNHPLSISQKENYINNFLKQNISNEDDDLTPEKMDSCIKQFEQELQTKFEEIQEQLSKKSIGEAKNEEFNLNDFSIRNQIS